MTTKRITLVAHTHWDREWYEPFEVFRAHLVEVLDEAIDDLERDPRLHFTLDGHVALVDDYLELREDREARIVALVKAGRLHVGPWYTQADTLLTDGEGLIRNLMLGIRRAEQLGGAMRIGYMPDQFGHAAQMPQLLQLFGIDSAVVWRGVGPTRPPHAFRWQAPDGSAVTTLWLQDGYGSGRRLPSDPAGFVAAVKRTVERLGDWLAEMPVLIPIGDDHVRLARWLPEAAAALSKSEPGFEVEIGGYQHHLPRIAEVTQTVAGELRSPAFAPVLAGVASARIREKQAAYRASQLLLRQAEPLAAWVTALGGTAPLHLLRRAWKFLLLNQAHDSAAGCGADAAHEDVQARYRWAEQLARTAVEQSLAHLKLEHGNTQVMVFTPGPSGAELLVETDIPKSLEGSLVATGPDGVARPIQLLSSAEEQPIFEGEFSAADLGQHLGGLDPSTPLFGKYLTGIEARDEGAGRVRLDVGLGETQVPARQLADAQTRFTDLLRTTERFKVVLHPSAARRRVLLQAGPAEELGLMAVNVSPGVASATFSPARRLEGDEIGIANGFLSVVAQADGTVRISDGKRSVIANDLVDEGDRGDLYHSDPVGEPIRPRASKATVIESGPLRACLRMEQELSIPERLMPDRNQRSAHARALTVVTDITLVAGGRRVELTTKLVNTCEDHRLRVLVHLPFRAERLDVEHGLAVVRRPLEPATALGAGSERAAPTGQHHLFADVSSGMAGLALMSRGLPEHEVTDRRTLALTLVRSVGWLSRGDLSVIDHAAGPMMATPGAQEIGPLSFDYALLLHDGDWRTGDVFPEARAYAAPPLAVSPKGSLAVPDATSLLKVTPSTVVITAAYPVPTGSGMLVRLLNVGSAETEAHLRPALKPREAKTVDPLGEPIAQPPACIVDGVVRVSIRPWQLVTLRIT